MKVSQESRKLTEEIRELPEKGEMGTIISLQFCPKCRSRKTQETLLWKYQTIEECSKCGTEMKVKKYTASTPEGLGWILP